MLAKFILAIIFTPCFSSNGGIFSWVFSNYENEENTYSDERTVGIDTSLAFSVKIPFELSFTDDKFLDEMEKLMPKDMTQLSRCNHKVIIELKSTCTDLSEEELSKIAVNLLNCQSAIENRRIYSCSKKMKIHECTKDMDQDTWNAYHIVSNRARAVCYQLRQEQLKAQTEMIVNQLITSAEKQSESMSHLHDQQQKVAKGQSAIHGFVTSNIRELVKEKSVIASGQKELARTTLSIKDKLETAQNMLISQGNDQQQIHRQILIDLAQIQENARKVWKQLDDSTTRILRIHNETASQYELLMGDLNRMNYTVHHLLQVIIKMKANFENKFAWISNLLGETDISINKINSVVIHLLYLFVGMVAASFLQVPYVSRVLLVSLVPLNACAEYHQNQSLPFATLTAVLAVCLLGNLMWNVAAKFSWTLRKSPAIASNEKVSIKKIQNGYTQSLITPSKSIKDCSSDEETSPHHKPESSLRRCLLMTLKESDNEIGENVSSSFSNGLAKGSLGETHRRNLFQDKRLEDSTEITTPDSSLYRPSRRKICSAVCRSGLPCRIQASASSDLCHRHLAGSRDTTPVRY